MNKGDHSHWLIKECAVNMAKDGLAAFAFDQEGENYINIILIIRF